jgi:hypothetical protein
MVLEEISMVIFTVHFRNCTSTPTIPSDALGANSHSGFIELRYEKEACL